jgi:hypothetical protein
LTPFHPPHPFYLPLRLAGDEIPPPELHSLLATFWGEDLHTDSEPGCLPEGAGCLPEGAGCLPGGLAGAGDVLGGVGGGVPLDKKGCGAVAMEVEGGRGAPTDAREGAAAMEVEGRRVAGDAGDGREVAAESVEGWTAEGLGDNAVWRAWEKTVPLPCGWLQVR